MAIDPSQVDTRTDLADFLAAMAAEVRDHPNSIENRELHAFLEGAAGWTADMDGYFQNRGEDTPAQPTWALVAAIFTAARVYE